MAAIHLPSSLLSLIDQRDPVVVDGATAREVLVGLETRYPRLAGWILDERRELRQHVALFHDGERIAADAPLPPEARLDVVPAITGGAGAPAGRGEAEVLVGTRKGLVVLRGPRDGELTQVCRRFEGDAVEYALRDPRTGYVFAAVTHGHYGPRIFRTRDVETPSEEWEQTAGPAFPEDTEAALERIWILQLGEGDGQLWAGVAPAALFRSDDGGASWELVRSLWDVPSRPEWSPGGGGLCLHSICPWPGEPERLAVGISAAGVWITEDGRAWERGGRGIVPRYLPEEAREDATMLCVHHMERAPRTPETLYMQFHGGVYRSDDGGRNWTSIADGLPSDFGFPLVVDPRDPGRAFVLPLVADVDRVTPEGRVRVYETRDRGATWEARGDGLPQDGAYLTVLRQAFAGDGGDPLGLYFGATSGELFGSGDGGATWRTVARRLPPVLSVRAALWEGS